MSALDRLREEFDLDGLVYLDHALRGPLPMRAHTECVKALRGACRGSLARPSQAAQIELARGSLARLLGWPVTGLAFTQNTTHAIATFAQSFPWATGDRVLVHEDEVPSNMLPWQALATRGVTVDVLPARDGCLALAELEHALEAGGVRVVSLAAVTLGTGERRDLAALGRLAHAHGALLCVDAAQAVGSLTLDLDTVDVVFGSGRKWLLGPPDVGFLAVRPERVGGLAPACGGALSLDPHGEWWPDARRFEGGALASPLLAGLAASLVLLLEAGIEAIEAGVLARAADVRELAHEAGLRVLSPGGQAASGIVHVALPNPSPELQGRLELAGVVVRGTARGLRVSAHAWNRRADVERLFEALRSVGAI